MFEAFKTTVIEMKSNWLKCELILITGYVVCLLAEIFWIRLHVIFVLYFLAAILEACTLMRSTIGSIRTQLLIMTLLFQTILHLKSVFSN